MLSQLQCHIWEGSQTTAHRKAFQVAEGTETLHPKHQEVFPIVSCPGKDRGAAACCKTEIRTYSLSWCFAAGGRAGDEEKQGVW